MYAEETIKRCLAKHSEDNLDQDSVGKEDCLCELGLNSLNFIQMIVEIEQEFHIEFEMEMLGIDRFEKVENLIFYVEMLMKSNKQEEEA